MLWGSGLSVQMCRKPFPVWGSHNTCAIGSLVIKSADICVQGFSGIELGINLPTGCSMWFLFLWQELYPSIYWFTSLVTSSHQKFQVTNFTVFHCPPYLPTGVSWCSLIISALNILFLVHISFSPYTLCLLLPSTLHFSVSLLLLVLFLLLLWLLCCLLLLASLLSPVDLLLLQLLLPVITWQNSQSHYLLFFSFLFLSGLTTQG